MYSTCLLVIDLKDFNLLFPLVFLLSIDVLIVLSQYRYIVKKNAVRLPLSFLKNRKMIRWIFLGYTFLIFSNIALYFICYIRFYDIPKKLFAYFCVSLLCIFLVEFARATLFYIIKRKHKD